MPTTASRPGSLFLVRRRVDDGLIPDRCFLSSLLYTAAASAAWCSGKMASAAAATSMMQEIGPPETAKRASQVHAMNVTNELDGPQGHRPPTEEEGAGGLFNASRRSSTAHKTDTLMEVERMRLRLKRHNSGWVMLPSNKRMKKWDCITLTALIFTAIGT